MVRLKKRLLLVVALLTVRAAAAGIAYGTIPVGSLNGCYKSKASLGVLGTTPHRRAALAAAASNRSTGTKQAQPARPD